MKTVLKTEAVKAGLWLFALMIAALAVLWGDFSNSFGTNDVAKKVYEETDYAAIEATFNRCVAEASEGDDVVKDCRNTAEEIEEGKALERIRRKEHQ